MSLTDNNLKLILSDVLECQDKEHTRILFCRKDRGVNLEYHQKYEYDLEKLINLDYGIDSKEYWHIKSFYKDWLLYEVSGGEFIFLHRLIDISRIDLYEYIPVLRDSQYESYGCIYSLFVLLDQNLAGTIKIESPSRVIYRLFLCLKIYQEYHWGKDILKDTEIYANMGRAMRFYEFKGNLNYFFPLIINPIVLHMYFFLMAHKLTPIDTDRCYDYHATAFMMYENQTVDCVTNDRCDGEWNGFESYGCNELFRLFDYIEKEFMIDRNLYKSHIIEKFTLNNFGRERRDKEKISYIGLYNQLEDYNECGFVSEPFIPIYVSFQTLIDNIGQDYIEETHNWDSDGKYIFIRCKNLRIDLVGILCMIVNVDENKNLRYLSLKLGFWTNDAYELFKKLKKNRVLFGIPVIPYSFFYKIDPGIQLRVLFTEKSDFGFYDLKF